MRPLVAIVGRPNVGKSSLFNRLVGRSVAIVDPTPGTTRDRILHPVQRAGHVFDLVDTGGIGIVDEHRLEEDIHRQIQRAIDTADRVIMVVDGRAGVHELDREIAAKLRPLRDRVVLAVNKLDEESLTSEMHQFGVLGLGDPQPISAAQAKGIDDLVERACAGLPAGDEPEPEDGRIRITLAGRRNVGKSSLTNALAGEERVIVADLAGTTRDAVDVPISRPEGDFLLIDTAGLRKRQQIAKDLEFYAACRTERAIRRADVVLLVLDASDEIGVVDKKLAHYCESEGKPTVLVLNKWDIAERSGAGADEYDRWLRDRLPGLGYAPIVRTCALEGRNLGEALREAVALVAEGRTRVGTAEVNKLLKSATERRRPKRSGGGQAKILYGTQAETQPPTFVFFANDPEKIEAGYARYLENYLRSYLPCRRVPMRILFKARGREGEFGASASVATKARRRPSLIVPKNATRKRYFRPRGGGKDAPADEAGGGDGQE